MSSGTGTRQQATWLHISEEFLPDIYANRSGRCKSHVMTIVLITRVVPKVMSNFFLHANWEQQTKKSAVVDGTSCCVILECLVTSIACITWLVSLLANGRQRYVVSPACCHLIPCERGNPCCRNSPETSACLWKCVHGCKQCSKWVKHFKDGKTEAIQKAVRQCLRMAGEFSNFQNAGRNVFKEVAIMWENKESYVD